MFEDLKEFSVSVPIDSDEKGYIDRQCPSDECEFLFKVNEEDWENIFKDEAIWCPLCKHEAPKESWYTKQQLEHAQAEAMAIFEGKLSKELQKVAKEFNRSQSKNSFISLSMKVTNGSRKQFAIPAKAVEAMQLEIICEKCKARFAVIGSAYFCPACGHNSVSQTFWDSLRKIKAKTAHVETIRVAIIEAAGKDEAELTCRSLRETCISDGVVAFQKYCEGEYSVYGDAPFNAFQRLEHGNKLWREKLGCGYEDWLSEEELTQLNILYQRRHILSHNEGIVDSMYINKCHDKAYKEGQRIIVSEKDVEVLVSCLEKLAIEIKKNKKV